MTGPQPFDAHLFSPPRHLHCAHYNACLDTCLSEGWESWQCPKKCLAFKAQNPEREALDLRGLLKMYLKARKERHAAA